ncbi:DNA-directed RNA polymerase subunit beta [Candidatus Gracilibacteria bacterium]|nr:DNA-directed RNA polymerase subunit beta [Candidatus Gracilibacteria bacterium]
MANNKKTNLKKEVKSSKTSKVSVKTKKIVGSSSKTVDKAKDLLLAKSFFDKYYKKDGKIFLTKPRNFGGFPDLLDLQKKGYVSFVTKYMHKLFEDINPVWDIAGEKLYISIGDIKVEDSSENVNDCKKKELTYGGIITGKVKLVEKQESPTKKVVEKILFSKRVNIGIMPLMTSSASYIINGVERVIISQIIRSYGIFYSKKDFRFSFKLIPENGPWLEVQVEKSGVIVARINKSRKFPISTLLRIFGMETDESIREMFKDCFDEDDTNHIEITLKKDTTTDSLSAAEFIYNKLRPGELIDPESALNYVKAQFLDPDRIYVGRIARRKLNAKLGISKALDNPASDLYDGEDIVASIKYLLNLSNYKKGYYVDDSDHLSNKRIRMMGEILYAHLQPVMRKFVKSVKGKLSVLNLENPIKITDLVNFKIIDNAIKSFFATSQLSQFLDQINPLSEVEHKRRITALGPGGLKRETAKFEVRDVHPSHYGRICPIETPEGQNIGLVIYQSIYSRVNDEGFLETPALKILREVEPKKKKLVGRIAHRDMYELDSKGKATKKVIVKEDQYIDEDMAAKLEKFYGKSASPIQVKSFFDGSIEYISPEQDEKFYVADATTPIDEYNNIIGQRIAARHFNEMETFHVNDVTHMDVNPAQIFSPNTSLIPFVDHNDAVRASIATNQQRQALPLLKLETPLVGTGLETDIVQMTHAIIKAEDDGEVIYVDGKRVKVKYKFGIKEYVLTVFSRSNHKTCITQVPCVELKQKVKKGDILAEGPCSLGGEMALGKNLRVAFMPWKGYNYEDAIVISQRLVKDDELTSIQIEEYEIEVADTKLGPEETTNDIPGVSMSKLKNLEEDGVVRIGSIVKGGDLLIGKITPKSEGELTPEEKLIQAIFGDRSKNVKDTSLYMPSGSEGKVIDVVILDAKKGDNLMAGVRKKIKVYVATTRKIEIGDKLAGKHGNKGIIAIVVPEEDMPYSEDGQAVDIVLNPLGVISRMNLGQLFETQLGYIAKTLGLRFAVPTFGSFGLKEFQDLVTGCKLEDSIKITLFNGENGEPYAQKVTVGYMHVLKLVHMVEDKIHARSVGPYSLITQQPLGGKSRQGGQRFGEMEVWSLEAYSAVYTLQEMLTVKSDDVVGRNKLYEAIIKGQKPKIGGLPESFNLVSYLFKGLCQNVSPLTIEEMETIHQERIKKIKDLGLSGLLSNTVAGENNSYESDDSNEEKEELIESVIKEMEDFGEIDKE